MNNQDITSEINRLNFENIIWIVFAILCFLNIYGDDLDKKYLTSNNMLFKNESNKIFKITISITILIYLYFLLRNYNSYKNISENQKKLYFIKVFSSCLLLSGALCLLYFQSNQSSFEGAPAL
jgi:hypothetical protein